MHGPNTRELAAAKRYLNTLKTLARRHQYLSALGTTALSAMNKAALRAYAAEKNAAAKAARKARKNKARK